MEDTKRAFWEMHKAALEMLSGMEPEDICRRTHLEYDAGAGKFVVNSMGTLYRFSYPDYICDRDIYDWH